jgi:hypothetical protein
MLETSNWTNAIYGMRLPMNSHQKMDSHFDENYSFIVGENDLALMKKLVKSGSDHRKVIRQIQISVSIKAPWYWWKEYDTYKISTVANSESSMHTIHKADLSLDNFSFDSIDPDTYQTFQLYIDFINSKIKLFNETKDKMVWKDIIQMLPSSFNQERMLTFNYENMLNMYYARKDHKLSEWRDFCQFMLDNLPHFKYLID